MKGGARTLFRGTEANKTRCRIYNLPNKVRSRSEMEEKPKYARLLIFHKGEVLGRFKFFFNYSKKYYWNHMV